MSSVGNDLMLELFRSEVESHSELLSNSLLRLERDPSDTSVYDSMMRSAHSIKGAARIVRVKAAVDVAHVMEDCFVAARGELQIKPSDFDLLLRSVDLLSRISEATKEGESQLRELSDDVHNCKRATHRPARGSAACGPDLAAGHCCRRKNRLATSP